MNRSASPPAAVRAILLLWLFLALAVGKLQLLLILPAPLVPALGIVLALLLLTAWRTLPPLRTWVDGLDLRVLVLLHVTRFAGWYFLHLAGQGRLPAVFIQAGYGDAFTAVLALIVTLTPLDPARRRRYITIWNVIGLVDILIVLTQCLRLALASPEALRPFAGLPLSLWPTFLVPVFLATHVLIFIRLSRETPGR